jgi:formate hydrogenlyase subunit 6/NADH:ubiquinone oxidoreductase subunit I
MQTIIKFFKTIFLIDLVKGLWITLKYTPQALPFTFQYPAERRQTSPRFRGGAPAADRARHGERRPASCATSARRPVPTI